MQRSNPIYTPRIDQLLPVHWSLLNLSTSQVLYHLIDLLSDEDEALSHLNFSILIFHRNYGSSHYLYQGLRPKRNYFNCIKIIHPTNQYSEFWNTPKMQFTADKCAHTYHCHCFKLFRFSYTPSDKEASEVCAKMKANTFSYRPGK
jgi:hypothetical protein